MSFTIKQFIDTHRGKFIGWRECVAAFWLFNNEVVQGEAYSAPGAVNLWTQAGQPYIWDTYDRITTGYRYGDWLIWSGTAGAYPNGGHGHVAMLLRYDAKGWPVCMSQNPGPFQELTLNPNGVVGALRGVGVTTGDLTNRAVTQNVAWVRTAPDAGAPLAPGYPEGLKAGATLAVAGYVSGQDPYGTGDDAWYRTKSGYYVWANAAGNNLEGLTKL